MLMMTPPSSWAASISAACHDASIVPRRSTAISRSSFSTIGQRGAVAGEDVGARVVDPCVEAAERSARGGTDRADRLRVGEVELQDRRAAAERADLALDLRRAGLVRAIGERDVGSCARRGQRDRATDAARPAGHEHGAAGQRRSGTHELQMILVASCDCW